MKKGGNTDMKFDSVKYFFKEAFKSITRNKTLSTASIATVAATLFILGVITLAVVNVDKAVEQLGSQVEVKIYLKDDITEQEEVAIKGKIEAVEGVTEAILETKEQALSNVKEQLGEDSSDLTVGFEDKNPFPASFTIKVGTPEVVDKVVSQVKGMSGIEKIKDAREVIEKITTLTKSVKTAGGIGFLVFIVVSLFLIGNTIKITVYSRKREIGIMKYVGATDWFIRWPFIIEGIILGVIGALISVIILNVAYSMLVGRLSQEVLFGFSLVGTSYIWKYVIWEFIICGVVIGALGSIISMRKFLKV